jgi:hypothetical protein
MWIRFAPAGMLHVHDPLDPVAPEGAADRVKSKISDFVTVTAPVLPSTLVTGAAAHD